MVRDRAGNLFGAISAGNGGGRFGAGYIFEITSAGRKHVLYSFCARSHDCADGSDPIGLVIGKSGRLYGATSAGGSAGQGVVFEVTPTGKERVLYNFCSVPDGNRGCPDGEFPSTSLVFDASGNLYGGTSAGGLHGGGVIFELTRAGKEIVLYNFCAAPACADGAAASGLLIDRSGNLYGVAGGGLSGAGVVFELTNAGAEIVLYSFCPVTRITQPCPDGSIPTGLVMDKSGDLYGTTAAGGEGDNGGTVFEISKDGTHTVLHSFCAVAFCPDGSGPFGLVMDRSRNLFGATAIGGGGGNGTVFEIASGGKESLLYDFCPSKNACSTVFPAGGLLIGPSGELFGMTEGQPGFCSHLFCQPAYPGTVFELTPPG